MSEPSTKHNGVWEVFVQRCIWPGFTAAVAWACSEFWAVQTLKDSVHDNKISIAILEKDLGEETKGRKEGEAHTEQRIQNVVALMQDNARSQAAQTEQISQVIGLFKLQNQLK